MSVYGGRFQSAHNTREATKNSRLPEGCPPPLNRKREAGRGLLSLEVGSLVSSDSSRTSAMFAKELIEKCGKESAMSPVLTTTATNRKKIEEEKHEYVGSKHPLGQQMRESWLQVEHDLHNGVRPLPLSVRGTNASAHLALLDNMRSAITNATSFLVEGRATPKLMEREERNPFKLETSTCEADKVDARDIKHTWTGAELPDVSGADSRYYVWSSSQAARSAIVQEVVEICINRSKTHLSALLTPLILLVTEPTPDMDTSTRGVEDTSGAKEESVASFVVAAWRRASVGCAKTIVIEACSAHSARLATEAELRKAYENPDLDPVLVCVHASWDSVFTSEFSSFRRICDEFDSFLCVEGPALSLIAQPARPSGPDECVGNSHWMILNLGSWFGFTHCAVLTRQEPRFDQARLRASRGAAAASSMSALNAADNDYKHGLFSNPVLKLWTMLDKIGTSTIRQRVDQVTALAESFVYFLKSSSNIRVMYDGVGCVIRISYTLQREDRLLNAKTARSSISTVNNIIYSSLEETCKDLMVYKITLENYTYLQFSPSRLFSSGTFWIPPDGEVEYFAKQAQEIVDKFESCKAGSVAFRSRVAKCRDIELVTSIDVAAEELALSFGSFRVVPHELRKSWQDRIDVANLIVSLTHSLVLRIRESGADDITNDGQVPILSERRTESVLPPWVRTRVLSQEAVLQEIGSLPSKPSELREELPIAVFLNSYHNEGVPDYISIEPNEACDPAVAVEQAESAADKIIEAIDDIACMWRASIWSPPSAEEMKILTGAADSISDVETFEDLEPVYRMFSEESRTQEGSNAATLSGFLEGDMESVETDSGIASSHSLTQFYSVQSDGDDYSVSGLSSLDRQNDLPNEYEEQPNSPLGTEAFHFVAPRVNNFAPSIPGRHLSTLIPDDDAATTGGRCDVRRDERPGIVQMNRADQNYGWFQSWRNRSARKTSSEQRGNEDHSEHGSDQSGQSGRSSGHCRGSGEDDSKEGHSRDSSESSRSDPDGTGEHDDDDESETETDELEVGSTEETESNEETDSEYSISDDEKVERHSHSTLVEVKSGANTVGVAPRVGLFGWMRRGARGTSTPELTSAEVVSESGTTDNDDGSALGIEGESRISSDYGFNVEGRTKKASISSATSSEAANSEDSEVPTEWTSRGSGWQSEEDGSDSNSMLGIESVVSNGKASSQPKVAAKGGPGLFGLNWLWKKQHREHGSASPRSADARASKASESASSDGAQGRSSASSFDYETRFRDSDYSEGEPGLEDAAAVALSTEAPSIARGWFPSVLRRSLAAPPTPERVSQISIGAHYDASDGGRSASVNGHNSHSQVETSTASTSIDRTLISSYSDDDSGNYTGCSNTSDATESESAQTARTSSIPIGGSSNSWSGSSDDTDGIEDETRGVASGDRPQLSSAPAGTVAKYFGWMAPSWSARASASDGKGSPSNVGGRRGKRRKASGR